MFSLAGGIDEERNTDETVIVTDMYVTPLLKDGAHSTGGKNYSPLKFLSVLFW
jgi:hypothetical protein